MGHCICNVIAVGTALAILWMWEIAPGNDVGIGTVLVNVKPWVWKIACNTFVRTVALVTLWALEIVLLLLWEWGNYN